MLKYLNMQLNLISLSEQITSAFHTYNFFYLFGSSQPSHQLDFVACLHNALATNQLEISFLKCGPHILCGHFLLPLRHDNNGLHVVFELFPHYLSDYLVNVCILLGLHVFLKWCQMAVDVRLEISSHEEIVQRFC